MDHLALIVLRAEALADCRVIADAADLARERFADGEPPQLEAAAFQLARLYNGVEQLGVRIAKAFENNIDDEKGWHMELLRRLSIPIPGIRPAFIDGDMLSDLNELRAFRHVVRHAYDLELKPEKMRPLLAAAERSATNLSAACNSFIEQVARHNGWTLGPGGSADPEID